MGIRYGCVTHWPSMWGTFAGHGCAWTASGATRVAVRTSVEDQLRRMRAPATRGYRRRMFVGVCFGVKALARNFQRPWQAAWRPHGGTAHGPNETTREGPVLGRRVRWGAQTRTGTTPP